ncbi:MAG: PDZ domain-containing protein [Clostridia bacterium]|nr:PDZ domain-containing protein [Clostridia bacterium]
MQRTENRIRQRFLALAAAVLFLFSFCAAPVFADGGRTVLPGGFPFGAELYADGVLVASLPGADEPSPARDAGILPGDLIVAANGEKVLSLEDLTRLLESREDGEITLTLKRGNALREVKLNAVLGETGERRIGVSVRDKAAGIGTVTFLLPETLSFGGLGHGICTESGTLLPIRRGTVCGVRLTGIRKGKTGEPGELEGILTPLREGSIVTNENTGVFGLYASLPSSQKYGPVETAAPEEVKTGKATVLSTVDGEGIREYGIEIVSIPEPRGESLKSFSIRVTDPALIEKTGGIVQGMSGSPILQGGKLVGAVTHVMVNDPLSGYGIFIDTMLESMPDLLR